MALFDKLFSLKRRLDSDNCDPKDRGRSSHINPEQVRLLLFKECDWRGRRLLFDSSAIQKAPAGKHDKPNIGKEDVPYIVEVSDGYSYVYKGPEADATVLGEMIFGAVAMNYKSVSLKIHIMEEPRRLMCTKVFCVPSSRRISKVERKTSDSNGYMRNISMQRNASKPLNVPSLKEDGVALSFSMDRGDSGFCGDQSSSQSSVGSTFDYFSMFDIWDGNASQEDFYSFHSLPGRKLSTSSNGSWQRRTFQNIATRFELGQSSHLLNVPSATTCSDSQIYSNSSSATSDSIASTASLPLRKSKLGLALLVTVTDPTQLDLVRKCVEHSPQLQALVFRLKLATLAAGSSSSFVSTLHRASVDAARWLSDLIYGPRLQPTWLSLVRTDAKISNKLAECLLSDLCSVLAVADTKTTNFFISTLLTHVLTYHLGWVTTVSPYDTTDHQSDVKRPYNALWAQLSDLCGSIGFPPRVARTIISGEKNAFINRLLGVLTYFLRCGDVRRTEFQYKERPLKELKTISVNKPKLQRTRSKALNSDVNVNSDSSLTTLVASDVSLKNDVMLSTGPDCGSSGQRPPFRRNSPLMLSSLKASSDSSLNSSLDDSVLEQKVVFVLGDDEKLVGLKNKSTNGKCVKKSSKANEEPVNPAKLDTKEPVCEREGCVERNTESSSKCCGQTLQHSKPIKHSGFKFEFDKYPQIVTNYMKSKNLEILDRHYIGKPGNLKLDNFQFDPMVVPPIQEERCDSCVKCQMLESMLQTPTNASEMEYMNDMPRISEPQYAKETVVTNNDNHREMSPKTFVRTRKQNVIVVNLIKNNKEKETNAEHQSELEKTDPTDVKLIGLNIVTPNKITPSIKIDTETNEKKEESMNIPKSGLKRSNKLKFTKSTNNLAALLAMEELADSSNELESEQLVFDRTINLNINLLNKAEPKEATCAVASHEVAKRIKSPSIEVTKENASKISPDTELPGSLIHQTNELKSPSLIPSEVKLPSLRPLERRLEMRRLERERDRAIEVESVTELPLPELFSDSQTECNQNNQRSGFDGSLLGGVTDHYVPDLILQGTIAKPSEWESELRRDLDITSYLTKQAECTPVQSVAIIADTNTWEVRVVGRDCGTGGMSSLVGAMLDALPVMCKAKVPAHQCLSFLESKLREFCVLSKTLADMLMSTDFCDIATLTKSLNIDVNDVPLLLAVATTHTPQVATRYGVSYR